MVLRDAIDNFLSPCVAEGGCAKVPLTNYNIHGVVVRQLKLGQKPAGVYTSHSRAIHWDGRNSISEMEDIDTKINPIS